MYIPQFALFWAQYRQAMIGLVIVGVVAVIGLALGLKAAVVASIAALLGLFTHAFAGLIGLLLLIPGVGPLIVQVLALPFIWLMNGVGYFAAIYLAKRGHSRSVIDSRLITVVLIVGVVIGYVLGKIIG